MKEMIERHAVWSGFTVQDDGEIFSPYAEDIDISGLLEKFANMIAEDCAKLADKCREEEWFDIGDAIREHYGLPR